MESGWGAEPAQLGAVLVELSREVAALRKLLLKHGHAQELFQGRVEERLATLTGDGRSGGAPPEGAEAERAEASSAPPRVETVATVAPQAEARSGPTEPQLRVLIELDQAVRHLLALATETAAPSSGAYDDAPDDDLPRSLREALSFLQIRVLNLQRSFGLEPIPARGRPFDDRCHRVQGLCDRPDLPPGQVVDEVLPGYRLRGEVLRPTLVIVNRPRPEPEAAPPFSPLWSPAAQ